MNAIAYTLFGALLVFMIMRFIIGAMKAVNATKLVEAKANELLSKAFCDARIEAMQIIEKKAQRVSWEPGVPAAIQTKIKEVEPHTQSLLRLYRKVSFGESGLEISAEFANLALFDKDLIAIGKNVFYDHILAVKPREPTLYEVREESVMESYASIFNFILFTEDLD